MRVLCVRPLLLLTTAVFIFACNENNSTRSKEVANQLDLKSGKVISCGPPQQQFGKVEFETSCGDAVKADFNLGIELLHSFEYDEAEKAFAKVIEKNPDCAMAYWGIAMSNFHALWMPPSESELLKGAKAVALAQSLSKTKREQAYIDAINAFYSDWKSKDHQSRCLDFEKGMEEVYKNYPDDKEAAIFYSLALNAAADPNDKTFSKQKKAGEILSALYPNEPNHPGIAHYLIHTYDYPELAQEGLPAARKYASIAPSSAHALHMPSHIFTRLGLWDDCIQSNLASMASAKCYAEQLGITGHWDEELHGLDYLVYAYLQKGDNDSARMQLEYLQTIKKVSPTNFKVAYAFAAIPSRYALENKLWKEAASLKLYPADLAWKDFPWQEAIIHFARVLGATNSGVLSLAKTELQELNRLHDALINQKDSYKANQVAIQIKTGEAWIKLKEGKNDEAIAAMQLAADMEDKTEKHPVTPGEVLPARELLGDMMFILNKPAEALQAYEADLKTHPNRFNALYGAAQAAEKSLDRAKAASYYKMLIEITDHASERKELASARNFLTLASLK